MDPLFSKDIYTVVKKILCKNKKWKQSVTNTMRLVSLPLYFMLVANWILKKCWLPIICPFLVFTDSHGSFRLAITLSHREGQFWITLSKSNVFFKNFSMKIKSLLIILVTDCRPCSKIFFNLLFAVYRWLPSELQMPKVPGER